jgi:hypothetical protein
MLEEALAGVGRQPPVDRHLQQRIAALAMRIRSLTWRKLYGAGFRIENHLFSASMS